MKKIISVFFALAVAGVITFSMTSCANEQEMDSIVFEHFRPVELGKALSVGDEGVSAASFPLIDDEGKMYFITFPIGVQFKNDMQPVAVVKGTINTPTYDAGEPNSWRLDNIVVSYDLHPDLGFDKKNWGERKIPVGGVLTPNSKLALAFEVFNEKSGKEMFDFWEKNRADLMAYYYPVTITVYGEGKLNSGRKVKTNSLSLPIHFVVSDVFAVENDAVAGDLDVVIPDSN